MYKIKFFLAAAIVLMSFSACKTTQSTSSTTQEVPATENALLWKIEKKRSKTSYLYGTIHIIPNNQFKLTPSMESSMQDADKLILEMKLDMAAMFTAAMGSMMTPPNTLKTLMEEEEYEEVRQYVEGDLGLNMRLMETMKPMMLSQQIMVSECLGGEGNYTSYEEEFMERFEKMDKPVDGLETAQQQMKYLNDLPLDDQVDGLIESVRNPKAACEEYNEMVRVYQAQQLDSMLAMSAEDEEIGDALESFLDERNFNWIPKLKDMMKEDKLFIAVGAAHLAGENGVVSLLRKEGYTLTPVK